MSQGADRGEQNRPSRRPAGQGRVERTNVGAPAVASRPASRKEAAAAAPGARHGKRHGASSGRSAGARDPGGSDAGGRDVGDRERGWRDEGGAGAGHHASRRGGAKGPTQRQLRVGEEIRHVLAGLFSRAEFRDPELAEARVTVTEVRLSPDLKHATVFIARLGRSDVEALLPSLRRVASYLRTQVAHALRLRVAPQLSFQPDTALEYAMYVDALLHRPEVARDLGAPAASNAEPDNGWSDDAPTGEPPASAMPADA